MDVLTPCDEAAPDASTPLQSAFCRDIRSKKSFMLRAIPVVDDDLLDHSGHCWCRITMQVVGADGGFVQPASCKSGRSCYKSHFDE